MIEVSQHQWYAVYSADVGSFVFSCLALHPVHAVAHRALSGPEGCDPTAWLPCQSGEGPFAVYEVSGELASDAPGSLSAEALPHISPAHDSFTFVSWYRPATERDQAPLYALVPEHVLHPEDPDDELFQHPAGGNGILTADEEARLADLMAVDYRSGPQSNREPSFGAPFDDSHDDDDPGVPAP